MSRGAVVYMHLTRTLVRQLRQEQLREALQSLAGLNTRSEHEMHLLQLQQQCAVTLNTQPDFRCEILSRLFAICTTCQKRASQGF